MHRLICRMEMDGDCVLEPFCREKGWFTTKWGTPTPPGNGKEDHNILWLNMFSFTIFLWKWRNYKASSSSTKQVKNFSQVHAVGVTMRQHAVRSAPRMRRPTWWIIGTAGQLKFPKVYMSQPLQTQICTYKMVHLLKRWVLYRMASWFFFVND